MNEFQKALHIVGVLQGCGHEAYFVGGWVRDKLLGIESADVDVVTSAKGDEVQKIFPECIADAGTLFHVNIVLGIEVATYRYDAEDDFPLFAECFSEDSSRRDLTINSMAYDPITGEYFDHWNGKSDLENKLIRFVGIAQDRIEDDPVRMIRACRFAAKIDGRLVPSAFFGIKDNAHLIDDIKPERIQKEILKAMKTDKPSIFWELLHRTGLLNHILPELDDCWYHDGGNHHSEFVHEHLLTCGDNISKERPLVRLAGYLHDIGKVEAYDENDFTFIGHEKFGTDVARDLLVRLKFSGEEIEKVCSLILTHMRSIETSSTQRAYRRTIVKLVKHDVSINDFLELKVADRIANARKENFTNGEINSLRANFESAFETESAAFSVKDLAINGNDVLDSGVKRGKKVGEILNYYFELVVDDPELNDRSILLDFLNRVDDWTD